MNEVRNEKRVRKKKGAAGFAYSPNQRAALRLVPHTFVWADKDKELEDMVALLDQERKAHKAAQAAKEALENELESLSQALFEEVRRSARIYPIYAYSHVRMTLIGQ